jgi:tetratricopeptide (TPR) repeat protein
MASLKKLIHEIHRRSLWQVVSIYLAGGWIVYQVVLNLTEGVGLPGWVPAFSLVLLLLGLPIVVATAFVQEGGPGAAERPGQASEAAPAEGRSQPPLPLTAPRGASGVFARLLTWPRAILGGVVAFALLGAGTTGYMTMRMLGIGPAGSLVAAGVIDPSERIIIADFRATGADSALAALVTEAFRIDMERSTLVRTIGPTEVGDALVRTGRDPGTRIDAELARELAEREGMKAFIDGEVTSAAGAYVLTARLLAAPSGELLSAHRETASDSTQLLAAIDRLSRSLRERTGESLRVIRRGEPLEQVTTPSLEALRRFTEAARAHRFEGDPGKAFRLLEEAIALDTAFASAHRFLGVLWTNRGRRDLALEATSRALRFPDRLTDRERYLAQADVHTTRREYNQAIATYDALLDRYPQDRTALNNTGLLYGELRDFSRAVRFYRAAAEADTSSFFAYANLGEALVQAGRFDEAREALDAARQRAPGSSWAVVGHAALPATHGDYTAAESALVALRADTATPRSVTNSAAYRLVAAIRVQGRLREASALLEQVERANRPHDQAERAVNRDRMWQELLLHERPDRAVEMLRAMSLPFDAIEPRAPPLLDFAGVHAAAGDVARARALLERYASAEDREQPWIDLRIHEVEGLIALAEGEPDRALPLFRRARDRNCIGCEEILVGRAFEALARPDSAVAAYERFLAQPSLDRIYMDQFVLAPLHQRLGTLHEQDGNREQAALHFARFVELWEHADQQLQPRVEAAQRALERLTAERGG